MFQGVTKAKCFLNPMSQGLANRVFEEGDFLRVLIIGSDPVSIMPHGALGRAVSGEAQGVRATDSMTRLTGKPGSWTVVNIPSLEALDAKTGAIEVQSAYASVCYLPSHALLPRQEFTRFRLMRIIATPVTTPISGNGDCLKGWSFTTECGTAVPTWKDVEMPPPNVLLDHTLPPGQEFVMQDQRKNIAQLEPCTTFWSKVTSASRRTVRAGDMAMVYSGTGGGWVNAEVESFDDRASTVRVTYQVQNLFLAKRLGLYSEHFRAANTDALNEIDPGCVLRGRRPGELCGGCQACCDRGDRFY
jgi:hypothetical protein